MIILDLASETSPVYQNHQSFYGQPFIWCMLHNFGGTSELYGAVDRINKVSYIRYACCFITLRSFVTDMLQYSINKVIYFRYVVLQGHLQWTCYCVA